MLTASLGASSADIKRLASCYWHSVEFGLLKEKNPNSNSYSLKAYGAGLLSSMGELKYSCQEYDESDATKTAVPKILDWDPIIASETSYPITEYQPTYFVAESLADAKLKMRHFCEGLPRPFYARYNKRSGSVWVDRAVKALNISRNET